ncbi:MAG: DUF309 domain-containing protein [Pseudomonadota bacterium]
MFDEIKQSVAEGTPVAQLHNTKAFVTGLAYFDGGFFWECHDVLEAVWRHTKDPSAERGMVLALIQLANARLKVLMLQPRAAWRLCDIVDTRLASCPSDRLVLGLDVNEMRERVATARGIAKYAMQNPY